MSTTTLHQSRDENEEEVMNDGQLNTATDNNVNFMTNLEDENRDRRNTDQLSHLIIIETVQYEDFVKQGEIVKIEDDNIEVIELDDDDDEDIFPLFKRLQPSLGATKPKHFTTISLECSHCDLMFTCDKQLNTHLKETHSISPFRCVLKDCVQTFDNKNLLGRHLAQSHHSTTEWHCAKCAKHYNSYRHLSVHYNEYHQMGHFQCCACTFTGQYKRKMYDHYTRRHNTAKKCVYPDCQYQTSSSVHLKAHQRTHSGIKPYRCKWAQCDNAFNRKFDAIRHIRRKHLGALKPGSVPNGVQLDPKDYVELVHHLLE